MNRLLTYHIALVFVLIGTFYSKNASAVVGPPDLRCLEVLANGNIVATWVPPADPLGEFVEYRVNSSLTLGGPYNTSTVAGLASNTFTFNVNGNVNPYFVYIETIYNDGTGNISVSSDTLSSMVIQLSIKTDSTCTLNWNRIHDPMVPSHGDYNLYRQIGTGPWVQIISTSYGREDYNDVFKVCSDSIRYRVEVVDASGCINVSAVAKDLFEDTYAPDPPVIDSASVDITTGNILLGWQPSPQGDTDGYIVTYFDFVNNVWLTLSTLNGKTTTSYLDLVANGNVAYHQYGVAAFDSCVIGATPNTSATDVVHRTMFLNATLDYCAKENLVTWTPYVGWGTDLLEYDVFVEINGAPAVKIATIDSSDTSFVHSNVDPLNTYCYYTRAYFTGKTKSASSNRFCINGGNLVNPNAHYLKNVTVVDNSYIELSCYVDPTISLSHYSVERSINPDGPFLEIGILPKSPDTIRFLPRL